MSSGTHLPAAQYLRMSTEHQQYSIDNQADAIRKYAEAQGFEVIKSYIDEAKSGQVRRMTQGVWLKDNSTGIRYKGVGNAEVSCAIGLRHEIFPLTKSMFPRVKLLLRIPP